ncbi:MAG: amino acid ABC transporter permease [Actinobacteria bacterium]|nr:amino acid ABC transporter permease [Actinomycetota bacterium]
MAGFGATLNRMRDGVEARSAGFSFRTKLTAVYAVIAVLSILLFMAFQFDIAFMRLWLPFIIRGVPLTLFICFGAIILATILALLGALGRLSDSALFQGVANFYVSFIRGTPLIVQIYFIYFALPQLAFKPSSPAFLEPLLVYNIVVAAILALGINYGAYMTEIFRAGIQSVSGGQVEAAHALGMNGWQTMRRIVLPQAVRVIIPPTGNEFIAMLKDSALVGLAGGAAELFNRAESVGISQTRPFETLTIAALVYWGLTSIFSFFQKRLETRIARGHVRDLAAHGH